MSLADNIRAARTDSEARAAWLAYADAGYPKRTDLDPEPLSADMEADLRSGMAYVEASRRDATRVRTRALYGAS